MLFLIVTVIIHILLLKFPFFPMHTNIHGRLAHVCTHDNTIMRNIFPKIQNKEA